MKILYLITRATTGGAQHHVEQLVRHFGEKHDVLFCYGAEGPVSERLRSSGYPCRLVPRLVHNISPLDDLKAISELGNIIAEFEPDMIHAHSSKAGLVGRVAGARARIPTIYTVHGALIGDQRRNWKFALAGMVERIIGRIRGTTIYVSKNDRSIFRARGIRPRGREVVIHNGIPIVDEPIVAKNKEDSPQSLTVLMIARFTEQKNQKLLIEAVAQSNVAIQLRFAGHGPFLDECKAYAEELGMTGRCRFLGNITNVVEELDNADLFALISWREGLPIGLLEAMQRGVPPVVSNVGGNVEVVENGANGFLVENNVDDVRAAIESLFVDGQLRCRVAKAARQTALREFGEEKMLRALEDVYNQVKKVPNRFADQRQ